MPINGVECTTEHKRPNLLLRAEQNSAMVLPRVNVSLKACSAIFEGQFIICLAPYMKCTCSIRMKKAKVSTIELVIKNYTAWN